MDPIEPSAAEPRPRGVPVSGRLSFRALRNGAALGAHELQFTRQGEKLTVDIHVEFTLTVLFMNVFRYRLRGVEVWDAGRLQSARFITDNNGAQEFMRLQRGEENFALEGTRARAKTVPLDWRPATHWNVEQLKAPMLNPQDGGALNYAVKKLGASRVVDTRGRPREAAHYRLQGENGLELWYDDAVWAGLQARVFDGSAITYVAEL